METAPSAAVLDVVAESSGEIFDVDPGRLPGRYGLDDPRMHHAPGALDRLVPLVFDDHVPVPAVENVFAAF